MAKDNVAKGKIKYQGPGIWLKCLVAALLAPVTLIFGVLLCAVILLVVLQDRRLPVPDAWAATLAERINTSQDLAHITFDRAEVGFSQGLHPQINLFGVSVQTVDDTPLLDLNALHLTAAFSPLIEGKVALRDVSIVGGVFNLVQTVDGGFDFGIETGSNAVQAQNLPEAFAVFENLFEQPGLEHLRNVEVDQLTVAYADQKNRQNWTFDGGRFVGKVGGDGLDMRLDLALLTGQATPATLVFSYVNDGEGPQLQADVDGILAKDLASQSPALEWLRFVDAPISGSLRTAVLPTGLGPLNVALDLGAGTILPEASEDPITFQGAKTYFAYNNETARLDLTALEFATDWGFFSGEGYALLDQDANRAVTGMTLHLEADNGAINPNGALENPLDITHISADAAINFDPFKVRLGSAQATIDGMVASGRAVASQSIEGWSHSADIALDRADADLVKALWPSRENNKFRDWVRSNILTGTFLNLRAGLRGTAGEPPKFYANFGFENTSVRYMKFMPPFTDGVGVLDIQDNTVAIMLEKGQVKAAQGGIIDLGGSSMQIPNMRLKPTPVRFDLDLDGPTTAMLSILDQKPFEFLSKANRPVDIASGQTSVNASFALPLKRKVTLDEITLNVTGTARNVVSEQIVPGRRMTAKSLDISVTSDRLQLSGDMKIGQVAVSGKWVQPFGKGSSGSVSAKVALSQAFLDEFNIALPPGSWSGTSQGDLDLTLTRGQPPGFKLSSNLKGAGLSIPSLAWSKSKSATGRLLVAGSLGKVPEIKTLNIEAPGLVAKGDLTMAAGGKLSRVRFSQLRVRDWLTSDVTLRPRGKGKPLDITLNGGSLDMRKAPFGKTGGGGIAPGLKLNLDRLQVTDTLSLRNVQANLASGKIPTGPFTGSVNGGTRVEGTLRAEASGMVINVRSTNAGGALRDAGFLKQANGGDLILTLRPRKSGLRGVAKVTNARVKDAPAVASILSAISVVGILEQADGKGLHFNEINVEFGVKNNIVTIARANAIGPSIGLSIDGYINTKTKNLDMQGVVSPFYMVNAIGAVLTRPGEGLIGINFNLKGPTQSPRVIVNPLSILTPGMFREIFRRPPPKL